MGVAGCGLEPARHSIRRRNLGCDDNMYIVPNTNHVPTMHAVPSMSTDLCCTASPRRYLGTGQAVIPLQAQQPCETLTHLARGLRPRTRMCDDQSEVTGGLDLSSAERPLTNSLNRDGCDTQQPTRALGSRQALTLDTRELLQQGAETTKKLMSMTHQDDTCEACGDVASFRGYCKSCWDSWEDERETSFQKEVLQGGAGKAPKGGLTGGGTGRPKVSEAEKSKEKKKKQQQKVEQVKEAKAKERREAAKEEPYVEGIYYEEEDDAVADAEFEKIFEGS